MLLRAAASVRKAAPGLRALSSTMTMAPAKNKLEPRLPRGFADRGPRDIRAVERMMEKIKAVYERYGFEPVETPFVEYTEALGKFLPDQDRPNEGVFSFQDDDESWLSLRYDLTAPLARYVAENYDTLPKPYRSYRAGWVFRNEKPGPGRFRQFMQFDADTVGASSVAADAEICMMAADTMEELGFERGQYVIKVNSRKVLDGVMEAIGLGGEQSAGRRLMVLRAIDKFDRLEAEGVRQLLGAGRRDESGDFTKGAGLDDNQTDEILSLIESPEADSDIQFALSNFPTNDDAAKFLRGMGLIDGDLDLSVSLALKAAVESKFMTNAQFRQGVEELIEISSLVGYAGHKLDRIRVDPTVVRGLEYYTGPVFEAQLNFHVPGEDGKAVVFGSVGGGGRYDGLVGRFRGPSTGSGQAQDVPATGFSVGVSRLASALKAVGKLDGERASGPVVVTVMDREKLADYQRMVAELRNAGVAAEMFLGDARKMGPQLKYADKRNAPVAIIAGSDEFSAGKVQIKDLAAGKAQAAAIADHRTWKEERPGQFEALRTELVAEVKKLLERQTAG
jgi:histidyl-tRNA synthetase